MPDSQKYSNLLLLAKCIHGTSISGGYELQNLIYNEIKNSGFYDDVKQEFCISLKAKDEKGRKNHKVDIFCINEGEKIIYAYNSKSRSFNNTESPESILREYENYKKCIEEEYPGYTVYYAILKDQYDPSDAKLSKYNYLDTHCIPVFCTQTRLEQRYNISFDKIHDQLELFKLQEVARRIKKEKLTEDIVAELCGFRT